MKFIKLLLIVSTITFFYNLCYAEGFNFESSDVGKAFYSDESCVLKPTFKKQIIKKIKLNSFDIVLDKTPLAEISKNFGSNIKHKGDAGESTYWLCYKTKDTTGTTNVLWLVSNEMGGENHNINGVAIESDPKGKDLSQCKFIPNLKVALGIPALGATKEQIRKAFRSYKIGNRNHFTFKSIYPQPDSTYNALETVTYILENNIVTRLSITQGLDS
jgi:hypothetical protein